MAESNEMTLQQCMDQVEKKWKFDGLNYRRLLSRKSEYTLSKKDKRARLVLPNRQEFAIQHILNHFLIDMALIARYPERCDHADPATEIDANDLFTGLINMFRNTLRLAKILDFDAETIMKLCVEEMK